MRHEARVAPSGVLARRRLLAVLVDRLNAALVAVVAREDVRTALRAAGVVPTSLASPAAFHQFIAEDVRRWGSLVRALNIVLQE